MFPARPRGNVPLADGSLTPVQALIRWDAVTYAERELAERGELGFPPAVRMASVTGGRAVGRGMASVCASMNLGGGDRGADAPIPAGRRYGW